MKMKIRNKFNFENTYSNPGSKMHTIYARSTFEGRTELKATEEKDIYADVQIYKEDCDIYKILEKMSRGDYSALDPNQGQFIDCTNIPKNINELTDLFNNYESTFNQADPRFKELFNNDYKQLIYDYNSGSFNEKFNKYQSLFDLQNVVPKTESPFTESVRPVSPENMEVKDE